VNSSEEKEEGPDDSEAALIYEQRAQASSRSPTPSENGKKNSAVKLGFERVKTEISTAYEKHKCSNS